MDKGAHFFRTDLQIHSPRDHQWSGTRPVSPDERMEFARAFTLACRKKGIQAVGITDHHDMCLVKFFQRAAQEGRTAETRPLPARQDPIIFPGVELLIDVPCQVIVLLDADADVSLQGILLHSLGITPWPDDQGEGPTPKALPFKTLRELDRRLDERQELRGRYIILPHVGSSGHKTLIRAGFQNHYATMPCVGGYIEHDIDKANVGILGGKCGEWGYKCVGVFQTSDSRSHDLCDLGCRTTWVKMSERTAEAIRQACLARESRISQCSPALPTVYISAIQVSDSSFMGPISIEFNQQFNALIGGRGTGKSTILEYLRWAMQDQPVATTSDIEAEDGVKHKRQLLCETLSAKGGSVTVHWFLDGVSHIVRCNSRTNELTLQVGEGNPKAMLAEDLRKFLPVTAYSQKQLSSVGVRKAELQRFIEQPIQDQLAKAEKEIGELRVRIRQIYVDILARRKLFREVDSKRTSLASTQGRAEAIQKSLPNLTEGSERALTEHSARMTENQTVVSLLSDLSSAGELVELSIAQLAKLPKPFSLDPGSPQHGLLQVVHMKASQVIKEVSTRLTDSLSVLREGVSAVEDDLKVWRVNHEMHQKAYDAAHEGALAQSEKMAALRVLRQEETDLKAELSQLEDSVAETTDKEAEFTEAWEKWIQLHRSRGDAIEKECRSLSMKSGGDIRAALLRGTDVDEAMRKLETCLKGSRIKQDGWEGLRMFLLESGDTARKWDQFMGELRPLAEASIEDFPGSTSPLPLTSWGLTNSQLRNIVEKLSPETWLDIGLTSLKDVPQFFYKSGDGEIPFEQASAGQQATALLKALLNEPGGPLIIDQPEDDLDNAVMHEIVSQIWAAKMKRQIIVASHNANLVVNGDAELVIHCDYASENDKSKGVIKRLGAIDTKEIRDTITEIMEGGRTAFELRRQKYNF